MAGERPTLVLLAGPNGAGKSTLSSHLLEATYQYDFINVDDLAKITQSSSAPISDFTAGRLALERVDEKMARRESFVLETTLSGKSYLPRLEIARRDGWNIALYYVWVSSARLAQRRVRERVAEGGHDVPVKDVRRRYARSIRNLPRFLPLCDIWAIYDNSRRAPTIIAFGSNEEMVVVSEPKFQLIRGWTQEKWPTEQ